MDSAQVYIRGGCLHATVVSGLCGFQQIHVHNHRDELMTFRSHLAILPSRLRPTIRRLLSIDREYRLRDALLRFLPVQHHSRWRTVVHATVWKAGSQWIRLVLSDPLVYRHSGLRVDPFGRSHLEAPRVIKSPLYVDRPTATAEASPRGVAFFVARDPRDILVSFYYSNLYSHDLNPIVSQRRQRLQALDKEEGLLSTLTYDYQDIANILHSWSDLYDSPAVYFFERLIAPDYEHWEALFDRIDVRLNREQIMQLLERYSFKILSGGRAPGQEDPTHKYRSGKAGSWRDHFTTAVSQEFVARYGSLLIGPYAEHPR